jgi:hypothetical protein
MTIIIKSWLVKFVMLWIHLVNSGNFTKQSKPIWFILLYLEDALHNVKNWHDLQKHNTRLHKHYAFCKACWIFLPVILHGYPHYHEIFNIDYFKKANNWFYAM